MNTHPLDAENARNMGIYTETTLHSSGKIIKNPLSRETTRVSPKLGVKEKEESIHTTKKLQDPGGRRGEQGDSPEHGECNKRIGLGS